MWCGGQGVGSYLGSELERCGAQEQEDGRQQNGVEHVRSEQIDFSVRLRVVARQHHERGQSEVAGEQLQQSVEQLRVELLRRAREAGVLIEFAHSTARIHVQRVIPQTHRHCVEQMEQAPQRFERGRAHGEVRVSEQRRNGAVQGRCAPKAANGEHRAGRAGAGAAQVLSGLSTQQLMEQVNERQPIAPLLFVVGVQRGGGRPQTR